MGTETQESEAQCVVTSFVSNQVAETQESEAQCVVTSSVSNQVAETQEPTTHQVAET
jgi:hypothetical protein